jgi:hypothetical protein
MLFRRFALAVALLAAALASQCPEFVQQYTQRLGGAIDELRAIVARFDQEASTRSLSRADAIARLESNPDPLAEDRGRDMEATVARLDRLERQRDGFAAAGPLSRYAVFLENFDRQTAAGTYADFSPAIPATLGGLVAAIVGFVLGLLGLHGAALPFRRRHRDGSMTPAQARVGVARISD